MPGIWQCSMESLTCLIFLALERKLFRPLSTPFLIIKFKVMFLLRNFRDKVLLRNVILQNSNKSRIFQLRHIVVSQLTITCSKLAIKTPDVVIGVVLGSLLVTLNIFHTLFKCFFLLLTFNFEQVNTCWDYRQDCQILLQFNHKTSPKCVMKMMTQQCTSI